MPKKQMDRPAPGTSRSDDQGSGEVRDLGSVGTRRTPQNEGAEKADGPKQVPGIRKHDRD